MHGPVFIARPPILLCLLCLSAAPLTRGQDSLTTARLRAIADAVLSDATFQFVDETTGRHFSAADQAPQDARLRPESRYTDWRYWNGVLNLAMMSLGDLLQVPAYAAFPGRVAAFAFDNQESMQKRYRQEGKWAYPFGQLFTMEELDDYGAMGASLIEVNRRAPQDRYRTYIERAARYALTGQNRLEDGTFVRDFPQRWTLWADDLFMSVSFLARMGEWSGDRRYTDDAARQVINFHKHLFNIGKGLMCHCWYSDIDQPGVAFWGRANGWAVLAQVDLLDRLPADHPDREKLLALFRQHILGIARYQDEQGLWHQLLDKPDSYQETSCSAMFIYAVARAVNRGYLPQRYAAIARKGWDGVLTRIHPDGEIEGVCTGTGVGDDLAFYYDRPAPLNDVHGVGAVLLAGAEVLRIPNR